MTRKPVDSRPDRPAAVDAVAWRPAALVHRTASLIVAALAPAPSTEPMPNNGGAQPTTPDLTARAVRLNNRSKAGADRYLALHATLSSKR